MLLHMFFITVRALICVCKFASTGVRDGERAAEAIDSSDRGYTAVRRYVSRPSRQPHPPAMHAPELKWRVGLDLYVDAAFTYNVAFL